MTGIIFGKYDQKELDREYDTRGHVPGVAAFRSRWAIESADVRKRTACSLDVAYGSSSLEKLDVFPVGKVAVPVQIFFHGGYWCRSDKLYYSFVADAFARHGALTIVANYSLCPSVDMDELVGQCRKVVAWAHRNAADFGGDPSRIFVSGHSAGAHIAAMLATTDWSSYGNVPHDVIKGVTAMSGLFDLEPIMLSFMNAEIGLTRDLVARNSPLRLAPPSATLPMLVAVGALESDEFRAQSERYRQFLRNAGGTCDGLVAAGHHHYSIVDAFCSDRHPLGAAVLRQMGLA